MMWDKRNTVLEFDKPHHIKCFGGNEMLTIFDDFREKLDDIMLQAMHKRIVLYGYGYAGRFIKWYAKYYHNIDIDYIISFDMSAGQAYDQEIYRKSLFDFGYKDVSDAFVWITEPLDYETERCLEAKGYRKNETYFDFYGQLMGEFQTLSDDNDVQEKEVFYQRKQRRDIQFMEWLEAKFYCNFVTAIERENFEVAGNHGSAYRCTTQKEIFPILDHCHCIPKKDDAIFDFGCGKGTALISFLDYGFEQVGGIEYEPKIYDILQDNMKKLGMDNKENIELLYGDASELDEELDKYNWFYFFQPFDNYIFEKCVNAICNSYKRKSRKLHIISIAPNSYKCIEDTGIFRLTNQFTVDMRQRVVDVFETYRKMEKYDEKEG